MHIASKNLGAALALSAVSILWAPTASATIAIYLEEVGSDVVVTASGTANITGLTVGAASNNAGTNPSIGYILAGFDDLNTNKGQINGILSNPGAFGTLASLAVASSSSGDYVGVFGNPGANRLFLPLDYVSGNPLSGTATLTGQSYTSLGVTLDTSFTYTWSYTGGTDSVVLNIGPQDGPTPAPTPAPLALMLFGLAGVVGRRWAKSRA